MTLFGYLIFAVVMTALLELADDQGDEPSDDERPNWVLRAQWRAAQSAFVLRKFNQTGRNSTRASFSPR